MDWRQTYKDKLITADQAAQLVKSGDTVVPAHAAAEPKYLIDALLKRKDELKDVEIWQGLNVADAAYCNPEYDGSFYVNSGFLGKNNRSYYQEGKGEFFPLPFSYFPRALRSGAVKCDVLLGHVSPPDNSGYCSVGISCDISRAALEMGKIKIAMVNRNMPRTCGDTLVHVSEFDYFVEADQPLYEIDKIDGSDPLVDKIGKNIADLIQDGDTLQMGQGKIPNAILKCLMDKKDLGIHTEVFSDNLIPLIEAGIINGARKSINKRKIVSTFIQGSKELYDYVNNNQMIDLRPVDYTNDIGVISSNDNMVAINSAIEIDLMGQVVSDAMGTKQFSGIGGQLDFIRGAGASKNGRPIIALPATAKKGTISRISAVLKAGTPIAVPRNDVHYIVTEYGAANVFAKTLSQRAKALINIAAPQFRDDLEKDYKQFVKVHRLNEI